jgi:hypothetical protein
MNTERITVQHIAAALTLLLSVILVALAVAVLTVGVHEHRVPRPGPRLSRYGMRPWGRHRQGCQVSARRVIVGVLGALALSVAACGSPTVEPAPTTPEAVAAAFAAAWSSGQTVTACGYTTGAATTDMQGAGICDRNAGWSSPYVDVQRCTVKPGDGGGFRFQYATTSPIANAPGFGVKVSGSGDGWKVYEIQLAPAGAKYCQINGGGA